VLAKTVQHEHSVQVVSASRLNSAVIPQHPKGFNVKCGMEPSQRASTPERPSSTLSLETARLFLREWRSADVSDLVDGLNNLSVAKWLAFVPHPYTDQDALTWIERCKSLSQRGADRAEYEFAIELKSESKIIGGVSLTRISRLHGTAGGGIWLNARYQGHGYGSEAFGEKIRFAFEDLNLRRLENGFFKGNSASRAMQQRFGYKLEGEKRQAYRCLADGELKDECITGLLRDEWNKG
jgi:ribosomal-protein-alanine N-acetyltransferase